MSDHSTQLLETAKRLRMIAKGSEALLPGDEAQVIVKAAELLEGVLTHFGWDCCIKCHNLRPPHGTKDEFGRELGFYYNDLTCAECRRRKSNDRYWANWPHY